jgi:hypothetical protein
MAVAAGNLGRRDWRRFANLTPRPLGSDNWVSHPPMEVGGAQGPPQGGRCLCSPCALFVPVMQVRSSTLTSNMVGSDPNERLLPLDWDECVVMVVEPYIPSYALVLRPMIAVKDPDLASRWRLKRRAGPRESLRASVIG